MLTVPFLCPVKELAIGGDFLGFSVFPGGSDSKESISLQCRRPGFDPGVGKTPWRREQLPTPVFWPEEFHGQRSLVGYSPGGLKELDMTELLHVFHFHFVLLKSQQSVKIQRQLQPRAEGVLPLLGMPLFNWAYLLVWETLADNSEEPGFAPLHPLSGTLSTVVPSPWVLRARRGHGAFLSLLTSPLEWAFLLPGASIWHLSPVYFAEIPGVSAVRYTLPCFSFCG